MSFTLRQLELAIDEWNSDNSKDLFMDIWYQDVPSEDLPILAGIGEVEIEAFGGGEGDGAEIWAVIKVSNKKDGERYFEKTGYYSSWGDSEMDGALTEVRPKQVMKVEYEAI